MIKGDDGYEYLLCSFTLSVSLWFPFWRQLNSSAIEFCLSVCMCVPNHVYVSLKISKSITNKWCNSASLHTRMKYCLCLWHHWNSRLLNIWLKIKPNSLKARFGGRYLPIRFFSLVQNRNADGVETSWASSGWNRW